MRATRAWAGGAAALLAACVSNPAPVGWLVPADVAATEAWGGWITADTSLSDRGARHELSGELIAVGPDSLFIMEDRTLVAVPRARVRHATLFAYDAQWGRLAGWGAVGTFAALSNGWFFGLTGPAWIIGGSLAAGNQSRAPRFETSDPAGWDGLGIYARFPQGLPPGLDRASLRPLDRSAPAGSAGEAAVTPRSAGP
jgi:hypothetical protein